MDVVEKQKLSEEELIQIWIKRGLENPWIKERNSNDPYGDYFYEENFSENDFKKCYDVNELKGHLLQGNWMLGTAFYYKNLCFIQQINGGDEWLVLRDDLPPFESINSNTIIKNGEFDNMILDFMCATPEQLKSLEYKGARLNVELFDYGADNWETYLAFLDIGHICEITESMYYYWLEVLPPYMVRRDYSLMSEKTKSEFSKRAFTEVFIQKEGHDYGDFYGKSNGKYYYIGKTKERICEDYYTGKQEVKNA